MSRYDKYDPISGGFRALLELDWIAANLNKVVAVSLNASGRIIVGGAAVTDLVGVVVLTKLRKAREVVDVMTDGEIVEFALSNGAAAAAGTQYFGLADGTYNSSAPAAGVNAFSLGRTIEATRLVVRTRRIQG